MFLERVPIFWNEIGGKGYNFVLKLRKGISHRLIFPNLDEDW